MNDRVFGVPQSKLSHYERLEVSPQADSETLRQAFRRLSKTLHPDTTSRPAVEAARDFQLLRESYDLLADPERRRRYDAQLQQQKQQRLNAPPVAPPMPSNNNWNGIGERRPLSGGEWFALLLLGLALLLSLVLGLGVAGVQGRAWQVSPDWLSNVAAPAANHAVESALPEGSRGMVTEPGG